MSPKERIFVVIILSFVSAMVTFDLLNDSNEGVVKWHMIVEASAGIVALMGIFYFLRGSFTLRHKLSASIRENKNLRAEAEEWQMEAHKYIQGLAESIDLQLSKWNLSQAEKEVALLLLKGLSLKEIADIRNTSEKTARAQSTSVYSKSGLSGRSELAAFFLEDLLQPQSLKKEMNSGFADKGQQHQ